MRMDPGPCTPERIPEVRSWTLAASFVKANTSASPGLEGKNHVFRHCSNWPPQQVVCSKLGTPPKILHVANDWVLGCWPHQLWRLATRNVNSSRARNPTDGTELMTVAGGVAGAPVMANGVFGPTLDFLWRKSTTMSSSSSSTPLKMNTPKRKQLLLQSFVDTRWHCGLWNNKGWWQAPFFLLEFCQPLHSVGQHRLLFLLDCHSFVQSSASRATITAWRACSTRFSVRPMHNCVLLICFETGRSCAWTSAFWRAALIAADASSSSPKVARTDRNFTTRLRATTINHITSSGERETRGVVENWPNCFGASHRTSSHCLIGGDDLPHLADGGLGPRNIVRHTACWEIVNELCCTKGTKSHHTQPVPWTRTWHASTRPASPRKLDLPCVCPHLEGLLQLGHLRQRNLHHLVSSRMPLVASWADCSHVAISQTLAEDHARFKPTPSEHWAETMLCGKLTWPTDKVAKGATSNRQTALSQRLQMAWVKPSKAFSTRQKRKLRLKSSVSALWKAFFFVVEEGVGDRIKTMTSLSYSGNGPTLPFPSTSCCGHSFHVNFWNLDSFEISIVSKSRWTWLYLKSSYLKILCFYTPERQFDWCQEVKVWLPIGKVCNIRATTSKQNKLSIMKW